MMRDEAELTVAVSEDGVGDEEGSVPIGVTAVGVGSTGA
jgi:hypothetical protein